jgi:hypothetical protein
MPPHGDYRVVGIIRGCWGVWSAPLGGGVDVGEVICIPHGPRVEQGRAQDARGLCDVVIVRRTESLSVEVALLQTPGSSTRRSELLPCVMHMHPLPGTHSLLQPACQL